LLFASHFVSSFLRELAQRRRVDGPTMVERSVFALCGRLEIFLYQVCCVIKYEPI
jgi:hypothetical protein